MSTINQEIINQIEAHVLKRNGQFSEWYIGISDSASKSLFLTHNVDKENGQWIYRTAESEVSAIEIKKHLTGKGCQNGNSEGDSPKMVYAYKTTPTTKQ